MASPLTSVQPSKPSFAKVAAMAVPHPATKPSSDASSRPMPNIRGGIQSPANPTNNVDTSAKQSTGVVDMSSKTPKSSQAQLGLESAMEKLELQDRGNVQETVGGTSTADHPKASSSSEDEQSHVSGSSSKLQSFDTKSIASVTTFQMDEKESLRPDDSASVQAVEEDESAVNSRVGSELGPSITKEQAREKALRRGPVILPSNAPRFGEMGLNLPSGLPQNPALQQMSFTSGERLQMPDAQPLLVTPDEKLMEAMSNPKDRLLLLQLEEKILNFLENSKDDFFDLPPQNSFGRMLAHKLSDYYNLNHFAGNDPNIVRVLRTSGARLPPPLSSLASPAPLTGPSPAMPGFKIMRRAGTGSGKASANAGTPASSSVPSKATSENGGDTNSEEGITSPSEQSATKDKSKMTREEREAQYEAARRRIFADVPESSDTANGGESSASMSRSSSTSGKKKTHRQRVPKDDTFEARSQFNAFYPGMHYANTGTFQGRHQNSFYGQQPYMPQPPSNIAASGYSSPSMPFQPYEQQQQQPPPPPPPQQQQQQFGQMQPYGISPQYGQQMTWPMMQNDANSSYYPFDNSTNVGHPLPQQSSNMSSPAMNQYSQPLPQYQNPTNPWIQPSYQNNFTQNSVPTNSPPVHWPSFPSQPAAAGMNGNPAYPYGQFQQQFGPGPSANQHPMPGSFNRSSFNPQTRSFVPNNTSARFPVQSPQQAGLPTQAQVKNHKSPAYSPSDMSNPNFGFPGRSPSGGLPRSQSQTQTAGQPHPSLNDQDSIQKKWGTPAHLPKKPPPSEVPSAFDIDNSLPLPLPSQQSAFGGASNGISKPSGGPLIMQSGNGSNQGYNTTAKVLAGGS